MNEDLNVKQLSEDGSAEPLSQKLDDKQLSEFSVVGPCYGCGKNLRGMVIPFYKQSDLNGFGLMGIVGYRCSSCGSMYCKGCRRRVLNFHWSSGFEESVCKKCNISMSRPAVVISDEAFEVIKNKPNFNPSDLRDQSGEKVPSQKTPQKMQAKKGGSLIRKVLAVFLIIGIVMLLGGFLFPPRPRSIEEANQIAAGQGFILFITIICGIALCISFIVSSIRKGKVR
jgi:hypothetical protein